ncbi:MAG: hypothetical protein KatS3mg121_0681 [Gammaproteobacteria bacterium]|nr:MAG: hypothetical protein KatS3mg121_0681 [Gammaproteobacteria bacterium]
MRRLLPFLLLPVVLCWWWPERPAPRTAPARVSEPATAAPPRAEVNPFLPSARAVSTVGGETAAPAGAAAAAAERTGALDEDERAVQDFAAGLAHYAPLRSDQIAALTALRRHHRAAWRVVLEESGYHSGLLPPRRLEALRVWIRQSLIDWRDAYLEDARDVLDPVQWRHLAAYEHSEFERIAARYAGPED